MSKPRRHASGRLVRSPAACGKPFFFLEACSAALYTLSLHDAFRSRYPEAPQRWPAEHGGVADPAPRRLRSEEHTSELQSRFDLVCRLLLEKKKFFLTATKTEAAYEPCVVILY